MIELNKNNFVEMINAHHYVLVDAWAPWCGPCKMIAPALEEISNERTDVKIMKLNVDDNQELALQHDLQSIPTLMLFMNGTKIDQMIGALPKKIMNEFLDKHLKKEKA